MNHSVITGTSRPMLRTTAKIVLEVSAEDFEAFIEDVYGQRYDFVAGEDLLVGEVHLTFKVERQKLDSYELGDLAIFKRTGEGNLLASILLTDLVDQGLIQPAEYVIYAGS